VESVVDHVAFELLEGGSAGHCCLGQEFGCEGVEEVGGEGVLVLADSETVAGLQQA
jgi:hypothetical protein